MRLEIEGKAPLENVTERQVARLVGSKRGGDNTFAILERTEGDYVQMLGGGVSCCLEWRDLPSQRHYRAYVSPPKVPWSEESWIGGVRVRPEETLFVEDVVSAFCAFLAGRPFPQHIRWRDVTEELARHGVSRPGDA